ncbi:MAG: MFS transporter [bacterium]|nr:MFS transporter [bacterium]
MFQKAAVYPRAFLILSACFFFNRIGASLIWPFITVFIREQTGAPLSSISVLLSIQAAASLIGTSTISAVMDRFGRKRAMLGGMVVFSGVLLVMSQATTLWQWAVLIAVYGILHPVFYVGTNAMVADLVAPEQRTDAYALIRVISNLAIAVGPAVGGLLIVQSNLFAYTTTAFINIALVLPMALLIPETLPQKDDAQQQSGGYATVLRDRPFMTYISVFLLLEIAIALVFNLLSVYTKEQYGILEDQYGRILAVNAIMVVLLQYTVTRITRRYPPFPVLTFGSLFYVVGLSGFALSSTVNHFILAMIVMTVGELIVSPTSTALVANIAPAAMRARYMGLYTMTFTLGTGIGPMLGGILSDAIAPSAIWYAGAITALLAAVGFSLMSRTWTPAPIEVPVAQPVPEKSVPSP